MPDTSSATVLDHPDGVTFLHVSSESSDHYYYVLPGLPTDEEIAAFIAAEAAESDEEGLRYLEHAERVPRTSSHTP